MRKLYLIPLILLTACSDDSQIIKDFESQLHHSHNYNCPSLNVNSFKVRSISPDAYQLKGDLIFTEDTYSNVTSLDKRIIDEDKPLLFIKKIAHKGDKIPFAAQITKGEKKYHIQVLRKYDPQTDAYSASMNSICGMPLHAFNKSSYQIYILDSTDYYSKIKSLESYLDNIKNEIKSAQDIQKNTYDQYIKDGKDLELQEQEVLKGKYFEQKKNNEDYVFSLENKIYAINRVLKYLKSSSDK